MSVESLMTFGSWSGRQRARTTPPSRQTKSHLPIYWGPPEPIPPPFLGANGTWLRGGRPLGGAALRSTTNRDVKATPRRRRFLGTSILARIIKSDDSKNFIDSNWDHSLIHGSNDQNAQSVVNAPLKHRLPFRATVIRAISERVRVRGGARTRGRSVISSSPRRPPPWHYAIKIQRPLPLTNYRTYLRYLLGYLDIKSKLNYSLGLYFPNFCITLRELSLSLSSKRRWTS
jgi:hypothetical protein